MSRIGFEELCCLDVEWYGVDRNGNVAVFCSAGEANVPEFVCADKERWECLIDMFDRLSDVSDTQICFKPCKKNPLPVEVAERFSGKGLYYFDSDDHSQSEKNVAVLQRYYTLCSKPVSPIRFQDLPAEIQEILKNQILPIDHFGRVSVIEVEDAYDH